MLITQCNFNSLKKWFRGSTYDVMAIFLSGGSSDDQVILSNLIDNWREIDNMSRNMVCYIYFDPKDNLTEDASIVNFVSWVREYNGFSHRDYRKDADAALNISREICNHYGIFEFELPGLLFIEKRTNAHQLVPVSHFHDIKQYLKIINIVSSYTNDVSLANNRIYYINKKLGKEKEELTQQICIIESEIGQLETQRTKIENALSLLLNIDSKEIENDYDYIRRQLFSYFEIAKKYELPPDTFRNQNINKYLKSHKIQPSKEFYDALSFTHKCLSQISAKYHIDKEIVLETINIDFSLWFLKISKEIQKNIEQMSAKKISIEETINTKKQVLNSLLEAERELCLRFSQEMESVKATIKLQLSRIISVYAERLMDVIHLDNEICKKLLRGLQDHNLFYFIKDMIKRQISFEEEQDVKLTMIRSAISIHQYDVFISCKSEDYIYANEVYDFLVSIGKHPFMANKSIDDNHCDEYNVLIRETIDVCSDMIVFLSEPSYAKTPYVSFEWNLFVNEKAAGRKAGNLIPIIGNLCDIPALPIALRQCQACTMENYKDILPKYLH